ncbi:c-type cytochrome [Aquicoccus sp.]|uniref:c-type cytochrome n=1 Tax=Aquicoccus sp. TaxID=2055851 RepID=UPI0035637F7F
MIPKDITGETMHAKAHTLCGLAVLALPLLAPPPASAEALFPYTDTREVARGEALYDDYCAACHGGDLEGEPNWRQPDEDGYLPAPPHDATGHTWHHPDEQLFMITKYGTAALVGDDYKTRMEGFADQLDDDEILAILAYIKSTWPERIILRHDQMNTAEGQ